MNLCDDGHDEVCYVAKTCPVCREIEEKAELESKIARLERELEEAQARIIDLEEELGLVKTGS